MREEKLRLFTSLICAGIFQWNFLIFISFTGSSVLSQLEIKFQYLQMNFYRWTSKGVWEAIEECQRLGLTKSIGVSNLSVKKLETILFLATIPPAVNQVEMNPVWQQRKLIEFCKARGIIVTAFSPLGARGTSWGTSDVLEYEALKQIAKAHGKTVAQVCLRWIIEQGATVVPKSFNKQRLKENLEIFEWALTDDDHEKISQIKQSIE